MTSSTADRASNADQCRWQRQALTLMTEVIEKGAEAGLPPLTWQLGLTGCAGDVRTLGLTVAEQERQHHDWAALMGWPVNSDGHHRHAQEPVDQPWMNPRIVIRVKLYDWTKEDES